ALPPRTQGHRHRRLLRRLYEDTTGPRLGASHRPRGGRGTLAGVLPPTRGQLPVGAPVHVPFLDLRRQVAEIRPEVEAAVQDVLDGGRFILGPVVDEFERRFADYCGAAHAVGVASGTDAITIALRAAGVDTGDEVITAANTCVPTVAAIEAAGAVPVLADVD